MSDNHQDDLKKLETAMRGIRMALKALGSLESAQAARISILRSDELNKFEDKLAADIREFTTPESYFEA